MGQEITRTQFQDEDFAGFYERLQCETALLADHIHSNKFAQDPCVVGFELESWLIDHNCFPAPINEAYLEALQHPLVTPELSRFNVELNGTPEVLRGNAFGKLATELNQTWRHCQDTAHQLDAALIMIGTLPTITDAELCVANISPLNRYYALNEQVMRQRQGRPIKICIEGTETLATTHHDVMLEAATTSFQIHIQVPARLAVRYYNASVMTSAPMVAASANSPILFGKLLWDETRIPLFEQSVDLNQGPCRVSFGTGYLVDNMLNYYEENLSSFPVLLPMRFTTAPDEFQHLRLHNGTIWSWNRPLIGFDDQGTPHFRIEHRAIPSGPSIVDQIANTCLYIGLTHYLANHPEPWENELSFALAKRNFYQAARHSLTAPLEWREDRSVDARTLLLEQLLPMAEQGLRMLAIDPDESEYYLNVIRNRVTTRQTGAAWQRAFVAKYGRDFPALTANYLEQQRSGAPVHEWTL